MLIACRDVNTGIVSDEQDIWVDDACAHDSKFVALFVFCENLGESEVYVRI